MEYKDFDSAGSLLPLGLMRVVIKQDGVEYDSRNDAFKDETHKKIFNFVHSRYKSYVDEIADADGYALVETDSDGRPLSFQIKDIPKELIDKINNLR